MTDQDNDTTPNGSRRVVPRPVFLVLALGELAHLCALTLLVADRFFPETSGPAGIAAWLVLILSPHAVVASGLVAAALRPAALAPSPVMIIASKVLSAVAALATLVSEIATGSRGALRVGPWATDVPDSLVLAALYAWDLLVLVVVIQTALAARPGRRTPPAVARTPPLDDIPRPELRVEDVDAPPGEAG